MAKKIKTEAKDFNELKKFGYELEDPQDEYSYQPDSGSTANGIIGKQEYGIDIDLDAQTQQGVRSLLEEDLIENPTLPIPGESEYSQKNRLPKVDFEK